MQWEFVVALVVVIPIILLPVAFIWYSLNISGLYRVIKDKHQRRKRLSLYGKELRITSEEQLTAATESPITKL